MRRALAAFGAVLLLLTVGAAAWLFWLALHPTSPVLDRVARWPGLGPAAEVIRSLAPPALSQERGEAAPEGESGAPVSHAEPVPKSRQAPELPRYNPSTPGEARLGDWGRLWVTPGTRLLAAPREGAPAIAVLSLYANLTVLDHRPGWVRVRFRRDTGWVAFQGDLSGAEPPLGSEPEPVRPVPARPPDPERLERARSRLAPPEVTGRLGPYPLYTDVRDAERLRFLDRVAGQVEGLYRGRYGREPVGRPAEVVLLFAGEGTYRTFLDEDVRLAGLPATGHSAYGIVALFDGGQPAEEVGATLIHELAHLLNRRALGPMLPSWLDEGIANDLASSRIGPDGGLDPSTLGGATLRYERLIRRTGARGSLQRLVNAVDREELRPLPELLALDWDGFVRPDGDLNYAHAAFWVRYLLAGEGGALAPGFQAFLDAVAAGSPPEPKALRERLGRSWEELDAGFRSWVLRSPVQ
jgi:hypothetical protein